MMHCAHAVVSSPVWIFGSVHICAHFPYVCLVLHLLTKNVVYVFVSLTLFLCLSVSLLQAGETVRQLLRVAKKTVPRLEWKRTPVVLRATAGLRLLPTKKAQAILDEVLLIEF